MSSRTLTKAAAVLVTGGLFFAPATASALDLSALDTGSLGSIAPLLELGSSAGPEALAPTPKLASIVNFRDVAGNDGAGYATADGKHLKRGVFYRANGLSSTSDADKATLLELGLTQVVDLRGASEITDPLVGGADKLPEGVKYTQVPIEFGDLVKLATTIKTPEEGVKFMEDSNRSYVTDAVRMAAFTEVLTNFSTSEGVDLFHCSSGKDRTGWTSMLLQKIAGVSDETIMADYMLSNEYLKESIAKTLGMIGQAISPQAALNLKPVVTVQESFLQAGLDQITASFGTFDKYITEGLKLSPETIAAIKAKLVV